MEIDLNELAEKSGENSVKQVPRFVVPTIRLQGKRGVFEKTTFDSERNAERVEMKEKEIQGVMLKVRRLASALTTDGLIVKERLFTNEHNTWRDKVTLFQSVKGAQGWNTQMIDEGTTKELKVKYPNLKVKQPIFFLLYPSKEVIKLEVKGKGLSNLYPYWKEFASNEHIFQFISKVCIEEKESPLGPYYAMTFEKGDKVADGEELELVAKNILEIADNIERVESYYAEYTPSEDKEITEEEIPVIDEDEPIDDEEPNMDEIPF